MRRRLLITALLCTTALTPQPAQAEPISLFLKGMWASIGASASTGAVATALGGASLAGFQVGSFLFGSWAGQLLLSVGLSLVANALSPKPNVPSPSDRMVNFAQPIAAMESVFGRVRKGGPYAVTAFQNARRHYGVILAAHEIDGVEQWYLDERAVEVEANGEVSTAPYYTGSGLPDPGQSAVNLRAHLGAPGQVADARLVQDIPEWTAAHDMAGLAYVAAYAKLVSDEQFSDVYGNSPPTGPAIVPAFRGARILDPRSGATVYSNNAALVWAWIVTERLGGTVDWDEIAIEADVCDQLVTNAGGSQQRRWTLNGIFDDATDYETLRNQVVAACDGYMYERPDGSIGLKVGRYIEPVITLTEDDFDSIQISENEWGPAPPTEFVARYVEPDYDWFEAASATWTADPEARVVRQSPSLNFVDSHNQAMRCLKRIASASRPRYRLQGEIGLIGYDVLTHRFVRVLAHGYDFLMEISRMMRGPNLAVLRIEGVSVDAADFDFDAATEEPPRPPRDKTADDKAVAPPTGIAGTATGSTAIRWTWNPQDSALSQQFRHRKVGATEWQVAIAITENETELVTPGLENGSSFEAEIRNQTAARRSSPWHASGSVTAAAGTTAPGALSGFGATSAGSTITAAWTTPDDAHHAGVRLYRAGSTSFGDAILRATIYGPADTAQSFADEGLAAGSYSYWAASINASGIEGPLAGPETATV